MLKLLHSSDTQSCLTLCNPMVCSMPGLPVHHQLSELAQTHVHQVGQLLAKNYHTIALISHVSKIMIKILQARLQQDVNWELPDVQAGFRKGRGTRDQIGNINWVIKKEFQKNIYFSFIECAKAFDCVDHNKLWKILRAGNTRPPDLPLEKSVCKSRSNS